MGTVLRIKGFKFYFVSFDCVEPMHIHVRKGRKECKYWLKSKESIILAANKGFSVVQLNVIRKTIKNNFEKIKQDWDEHCGKLGNINIMARKKLGRDAKNDPFSLLNLPEIKKVEILKNGIKVHLADKRIIQTPFTALLKKATLKQRKDFDFSPHFIFWDEIDEIIGVKNLLNGSIKF